MKNNKKGFTLLELVVVILVTVIIFTSVLITGINLKKEAKINPDFALVNTVNTIIKDSKSAKNIEGIDDVITLMAENGYSETSLRVKLKDEHFGFDATNKRLFLVDNSGNVILSDKEVDEANSYIIVFSEEDLVVNGKLYLYNDIEITKDIALINDHDIDLNGKTITSNYRIYLQGKTPNEITISNGTIKAKEIFLDEKGNDEVDNTIVFGLGTKVYVNVFKSRSSVVLAENAFMDISDEMELFDNIIFRVSGMHILNLPAKITYAPTVKVANTMTSEATVTYSEGEFVNIIVDDNNEKLYLKNTNDFVNKDDSYVLESGYYIMDIDELVLNKPLKIEEGSVVTINFVRKTLKFNSEYGIINNGELRIAGQDATNARATVVAGRYGIKNFGKLEIDNVNISVGNGAGDTGYLTYNGKKTVGIENLAENNLVNIIKSTITADIGIDSSVCDINIKEATIKAGTCALRALGGTINIGTVEDSVIHFDTECVFGTATRVTIGSNVYSNRNISLNGYTSYTEETNLKDYTK